MAAQWIWTTSRTLDSYVRVTWVCICWYFVNSAIIHESYVWKLGIEEGFRGFGSPAMDTEFLQSAFQFEIPVLRSSRGISGDGPPRRLPTVMLKLYGGGSVDIWAIML